MASDEDVDRYIYGRGGRGPLFPGDLIHDIDPDRSPAAYGLGGDAVLDALEVIRQAVARGDVSIDDVRAAVAPIAEVALDDEPDDDVGMERERYR